MASSSTRKRIRDEGERRSKAQEVRHHQNVVHLNVAEHDASELEQSTTAGLYLWRNELTTDAAKRIACVCVRQPCSIRST
jgi:hypothetical protein